MSDVACHESADYVDGVVASGENKDGDLRYE